METSSPSTQTSFGRGPGVQTPDPQMDFQSIWGSGTPNPEDLGSQTPILTPNPPDLGSKWLPTFGREVPTSGWDPKSFGFWIRTLSGYQKSTIFDAKSQILTLNPSGFGSKSGILPRGALVSPNLRLKLRSRAPPGTPERTKIYRFGTSDGPQIPNLESVARNFFL